MRLSFVLFIVVQALAVAAQEQEGATVGVEGRVAAIEQQLAVLETTADFRRKNAVSNEEFTALKMSHAESIDDFQAFRVSIDDRISSMSSPPPATAATVGVSAEEFTSFRAMVDERLAAMSATSVSASAPGVSVDEFSSFRVMVDERLAALSTAPAPASASAPGVSADDFSSFRTLVDERLAVMSAAPAAPAGVSPEDLAAVKSTVADLEAALAARERDSSPNTPVVSPEDLTALSQRIDTLAGQVQAQALAAQANGSDGLGGGSSRSPQQMARRLDSLERRLLLQGEELTAALQQLKLQEIKQEFLVNKVNGIEGTGGGLVKSLMAPARALVKAVHSVINWLLSLVLGRGD